MKILIRFISILVEFFEETHRFRIEKLSER